MGCRVVKGETHHGGVIGGGQFQFGTGCRCPLIKGDAVIMGLCLFVLVGVGRTTSRSLNVVLCGIVHRGVDHELIGTTVADPEAGLVADGDMLKSAVLG